MTPDEKQAFPVLIITVLSRGKEITIQSMQQLLEAAKDAAAKANEQGLDVHVTVMSRDYVIDEDAEIPF